MSEDLSPYLPLSPAVLHILLALASGDLHGYGLMQEVERQSDGQYKLGPGTLYDNLQRLTVQGLVEQVSLPKGQDPRRRYYRLSPLGRRVLSADVSRLEEVVREAIACLGRTRSAT
jgi:DNA-binding PadR family transcriptional regulator